MLWRLTGAYTHRTACGSSSRPALAASWLMTRLTGAACAQAVAAEQAVGADARGLAALRHQLRHRRGMGQRGLNGRASFGAVGNCSAGGCCALRLTRQARS